MKTMDWKSYWLAKNSIKYISKNYWFSDIFLREFAKKPYTTSLEIGGFPGYYSIWLCKYLDVKASMIDSFYDPKIFNDLCIYNELEPKSIKFIHKDVFNLKPSIAKYDLVFSIGLVEHFTDPMPIIKKHWDLVAKGGMLIIVIPNFLGINGVFQLLFDPENLSKHNLSLMLPNSLSHLLNSVTKTPITSEYYGGFNIWLEKQSIFSKAIAVFSFIIGQIFRFLSINTSLTSPYIVVLARKI